MCSLALIQTARLLLRLSRRVQGGVKGEMTHWKENGLHESTTSCDIVVSPFESALQKQGGKTLKLTPVFLKGHIWDWMWLCAREGLCHACIDGMLPSIHLCCLLCCECQTQRLWHPPPFWSPLFTPPYPTWPSSLKQQPWPTWLTEPPAWGLCAPNEPYNNVTSNVKARVISACVCVCVEGVGHGVGGVLCSCHSLPSIPQCNQMH